jgi:hypothetical protein
MKCNVDADTYIHAEGYTDAKATSAPNSTIQAKTRSFAKRTSNFPRNLAANFTHYFRI